MHNVSEVELVRKGWLSKCMKVRDIIKIVEADGWRHIETKGDHRQYKHHTKRGRVTIAGHASDDVHPKTVGSILRQAQISSSKRLREDNVQYEVVLASDEQLEG